MKPTTIFFDRKGNPVTNIDLLRILEDLKAYECEVLYIHSCLSFGLPNPELRRLDILEAMYEVLLELKVPNLCMPTFTFSFCNGKNFDKVNSKSKMGALNEFFRVQQGVIRSSDPLMSVALLGTDKRLINEIGIESVGKDSNFDLLRRKKNVRFLFLGTKIGDCFTYMHYLEWLYKVDYRYDRTFKGIVIENELEIPREYTLFVRYNGVLPNSGSYKYEQEMYDTGFASQKLLGDSTVSVVEETNASDCYKSFLNEDPYFFVNIDPTFGIKDKSFILNKEMVAL